MLDTVNVLPSVDNVTSPSVSFQSINTSKSSEDILVDVVIAVHHVNTKSSSIASLALLDGFAMNLAKD
jgi:hypothetical protein